MKISDFSIIFTAVSLCFSSSIKVKSDILYEKTYVSARFNTIMDGAVENALRAAYEKVDGSGKPVVNKETASSYFMDEISIMFDGIKYFKDYYSENIVVMIYTEDNGYYYYDRKNGWSSIIYYSEMENTEHSVKIMEIVSFVEERYNIMLAVPYNDGEVYENTLDNYSFLTVYRGYDLMLEQHNYNMYCFSAAKISDKKASVGRLQEPSVLVAVL